MSLFFSLKWLSASFKIVLFLKSDYVSIFSFVLFSALDSAAIMIYVLSTILAIYSKPYMIHKFHEQFEEEQKINTSTSGQTSIVESTALSNYVNAKSGLYFALYLVFAMGMLGTVLSTNLIEFYIFFEVMLIPGFFLVALWGDGPRRKIGLMFLFNKYSFVLEKG